MPNASLAAMSAEHETQIKLLDDLGSAVSQGESNSGLRNLLNQLIDFTEMHFVSEQSLMRRQGYPGYEAHVLEHDRLIREVRRLEAALHDGGPAGEVLPKLRDWLVGHIETADEAFVLYMDRETAAGMGAGATS